MTPAGIEPATFRFVAQHLNHCATVEVGGEMMIGGGGEESRSTICPTITYSTTNHIWSRPGHWILSDFVHVESERGLFQTGIHISPIAYVHNHKLTEKNV